MCDGSVVLRVHVEVGIKQIEFHAAYIHTPNVAVDDSSRVGHLQNHRVAVFIENLLNRELIEVLGLVVGNLLTVDAEALCEVAVAIEQSCPHMSRWLP